MNPNYKNLFLLGTLAIGTMMIGLTSCSSDSEKMISATGVSIMKVNGTIVDENNPLTLIKGKSDTLKAVVTPENADIKSITWTSKNRDVAIVEMVNGSGVVTAIGVGNATITATANDLSGKSGSCNVVVSKETNHVKELDVVIGGQKVRRKAIQLWDGGPYFAEFNVGATIESYGEVTSRWGEILEWDDGNECYKFKAGATTADTLELKSWVGNYYNWGVVMDQGLLGDNKGRYLLNNELAGITNISCHAMINKNDTLGDVATKNWGTEWRMPTHDELMYLVPGDKVDTCWKDGINKQFRGSSIPGMCFIGKGDYKNDTVFFPVAGYCNDGDFYDVGRYGYYWSSLPFSSNLAWLLYFYNRSASMYNCIRLDGQSVRAVCAKN